MQEKTTKEEALTTLFGWPLILLLILILPAFARYGVSANTPLRPDKYIVRHWDTVNGLPHGTVTCFARDGIGFLWMGTPGGLVRFDGDDFTVFPGAGTGKPEVHSVSSILISYSGEIYVGTLGGGLSVFNPISGKFRNYSRENGLPCNFINAIAGDRKNVWIGTSGKGLVRMTSHGLKVLTWRDGLSHNLVHKLLVDWKGRLWIGTENGLSCLEKGKFTNYYVDSGLIDNRITALHLDSEENLWVGTAKGINRIHTGVETAAARFDTVFAGALLSDLWIDDLSGGRDGIIWVAGPRGLIRLTPRKGRNSLRYRSERIPSASRICSETPVISLYAKNNGSVWFGTGGKGFGNLRQPHFGFYNTNDGLSHPFISTIYQDREGVVWIGTYGGGLNRFINGRFRVYNQTNGLTGDHITAVCRDGLYDRGDLWVGTKQGLNRMGEDGFSTFTVGDNVSGSAINLLFNDREGNLWVGMYGGLRLFRDGEFYVPYNPHSGRDISDLQMQCIAQDIDGNLWVGTQRGLYCLQQNRFKPFEKKNALTWYSIYDIYPDANGILWLGTNRGLVYFDSKKGILMHYPKASAFVSAPIYRIFEDNTHNLWLSSNRGLYSVHKDVYNSRVDAHVLSKIADHYVFQQSDGLPTAVFTGGHQSAGWKMTNGIIWLPTTTGICIFDPIQMELEHTNLAVKLEKVVVSGNPMPLNSNQPPSFPETDREIEFYYTAINLIGLENLKFKYKLIGAKGTHGYTNMERIIDGSRKRVVFPQLPPGRFVFEITAGNSDKGWSSNKASYTFDITSKFSMIEKFVFLFVVVTAVLLVVVSKIVERRTRKKEIMRIFKEDARYKTSALDNKRLKDLMNQLLDIMEQDKPYLDPDMSVAKLAKTLGTPKEHISQIINQRFYMNFNQFLNKYRVEEAKKRLLDPKESQFVVLKIAHDVGFNSKSTFNSAFKRFTGISPSEYQKKHKE
jgi:ligand-binding sensor domain-containing protein/AraC-like DNA-binding protein